MIVRCCQAVLLTLFFVSSTGCNISLQSSQFTFVKNLLKAEPLVAGKNWQVAWGGRVYPVYAVNHDGGIYFADESGLLVSFDGAQVTSLILPGSRAKKVVQIEKKVLSDEAISLQFRGEDGRKEGSHTCSLWQAVAIQSKFKGWDQHCEAGPDKYVNEIRVNENRQIVALKQVLLPGEPAIFIAQL